MIRRDKLPWSKKVLKDSLIKLPRSVSVGVSEVRMTGSSNAQMLQFPVTDSETSGDFPKGMSPAQLAEIYGYKFSPAGQASHMTFRLGFFTA